MQATSAPPIGTRIKLGYAVGSAGLLSVSATATFFLLIFLTDVAGVSPVVAGLALTLGKLWDTVNDPLIGWMSDRTRSRHGRRRIYMLWGAVPLGIFTAALWMVPSGLSPLAAFAWILIVYVLYDTAHAVVHVPYVALAADLTFDYDDRTQIVVYGSIGALIGYLVGSAGVPMLLRGAGDLRTGYAMVGVVLGTIATVAIAYACFTIHERIEITSKAQRTPVWTSLLSAFGNRPFMLLAAALAVVRTALTLIQTLLTYFVLHVLQGDMALLAKLMAALLCAVALSIPLWRLAAVRWEKRVSYAVGIVLMATGAGLSWLLGPHEWIGAFVLSAATGLGMGAQWVLPYAMLPDSIDAGQATSAERRSGMYVGVFGLVDKSARMIGLGMVAVILDHYGYASGAAITPQALEGIRVGFTLVPSLLLVAAIPMVLAYPITREKHRKIQQKIFDDQAPRAAAAPLPGA